MVWHLVSMYESLIGKSSANHHFILLLSSTVFRKALFLPLKFMLTRVNAGNSRNQTAVLSGLMGPKNHFGQVKPSARPSTSATSFCKLYQPKKLSIMTVYGI